MRENKRPDAWLDQSQVPPDSARETALRPPRSSNVMLVSLAAAAAAVFATLAFVGWRDSMEVKNARMRRVAPATAPQVESLPLPWQPAREPQSQVEPRVQRFAKCTSTATGTVTYSDGTCPPGTRAGEVLVRPDTNLADGMSPQARQASMRRNSDVAQSVIEHERSVAMNIDRPATECAQLDALIAAIDASARQPQPRFEQDRLKDQRQRARDRQFALRCG